MPISEDITAAVVLVVILAFLIEYSVVFLIELLRSSFDIFDDAAAPVESAQVLMTRRAIALALAGATVLMLRIDLLAVAYSNQQTSPTGLVATAFVMSAGGWAGLEAAARLLRVPLPRRSDEA